MFWCYLSSFRVICHPSVSSSRLICLVSSVNNHGSMPFVIVRMLYVVICQLTEKFTCQKVSFRHSLILIRNERMITYEVMTYRLVGKYILCGHRLNTFKNVFLIKKSILLKERQTLKKFCLVLSNDPRWRQQVFNKSFKQ